MVQSRLLWLTCLGLLLSPCGLWAEETADAAKTRVPPPPGESAPLIKEEIDAKNGRLLPVIDTAPVRAPDGLKPSETPAERLQTATRSDEWLSESLAALQKERKSEELGRRERGHERRGEEMPARLGDRRTDRSWPQGLRVTPVPTTNMFSLTPRLGEGSRTLAGQPSPSPPPNPYLAPVAAPPRVEPLAPRPLATPVPRPTPNPANHAQSGLSPIETGLER